MSGNNKGTHTKTRPDRDLWYKVSKAADEVQENIKYKLDLDWEDEMECTSPVPTYHQVISQIENKRESPLTKDEKNMIEIMYLVGIDDGLTFREFCDKYYGYNEYDDDDDDDDHDEYILSLQEK